jgi:pseudooxynicotine dehydrogenase
MSTDVVIVGGGFAGVTAARELTMRGRSAVLVEARDRLGGRTHTALHEGHALELGGTWVHPAQPNVWAEITRYGLDIEEMPVPGGRQAVLSAGRLVELDRDGRSAMVGALARFCAPAASLFPMPYEDRPGPDPQRYGDRSVREVLGSAVELQPVPRDALDAICCTLGGAPLDQVSAAEIMRVFALAGCNPIRMFAALSGLKLADGTRSLIDAIASQAELTAIRLSSPVHRVTQTGEGVRVELASGEAVAARTALITLPINVLNHVTFEPDLSPIKRAAATQRHAGSGVKCYVHVRGDVGNLSFLAPEAEAINWVATYHHGAEGSLLIVFGNDPKRLPVDDVATMQVALRRMLPDVEVERIFAWDWAADPLALGTWCVFKPGQAERFLPELRRSEGRVFFASGDSALAWRGFIDGAIESGYRAAREIDDYLGAS